MRGAGLPRGIVVACLVVSGAAVTLAAGGGRPASLPTNGVLALVRGDRASDPDATAALIHDYGGALLVRLVAANRLDTDGRVHRLPSGSEVGFRGWSGAVPAVEGLSEITDGLHILRLVGPLDRRWRSRLEAAGVVVLAPAHPYALVVRTDRTGLARALGIETSEGLPVIEGVAPLPPEARVHRSLVPVVRGADPRVELELTVVGWTGRPASAGVKRRVGGGEVVRWTGADLARALVDDPEIGYVEPVFGIALHNNLAARPGLIGAEPVWDLGYNGRGLVIAHNDSGVDLVHPDLAGAVDGAIGRMAYADTAHGTHTAGSIVGRGLDASPTNSSGCGDVTPGLSTARGMAWGATLVTNNLFEDGLDRVVDMMAWAAGSGAQLSSNSWGLLRQTGPEVGYSAAAVEADAAVRDADPETPEPEPLTVFFSAGNTGPGPGTVTSPGTAKNVVTIGAVENDRCGAWVPANQPGPDPTAVLTSSGRGPSQGRVKPDLVAPGSDVLSLESGDPYAVQAWDLEWTGPRYAINTGTSQACALAAGAGAVLHELFWRSRGRHPSPALLKAALVATADDGAHGIDDARGWGRLDLAGAVAGPATNAGFVLDEGETAELGTGQGWGGQIVVRPGSPALTVALVWTDVPGEADAEHPLVNDLDLVLTGPSGTIYRGNVFEGRWSVPNPPAERDRDNNVEVVRVEVPEAGTWIAEVVAVDVPSPPPGLGGQDFALAVSGDAGPCAEAPPPPATVEAEDLGDNRIRVSWSAVSGASRYELSRSLTAGGHPYLPVLTVAAGVTSFVDTDVSGGSTYHYVLRTDRGCWSEYSAEASATASGTCRQAPQFEGVRSVAAPAGATCALDLTWEDAVAQCPAAVLYDIYRSEDPDFEPGADNLVVESLYADGWTDRPLDGNREYFYVVRARHSTQGSDDGNTRVLGGRPSGPEEVYLEEGVEGQVDAWITVRGSDDDAGSEPWRVTDDDAWTGARAWLAVDEDRVKDQVLLTAEPVDLDGAASPVLEFYHRYRLHRGRDGGRLEVSTNGGLDWIDILEGDGQSVVANPGRWLEGGYTDTIGAPTSPLFLADGWTGDSRGWLRSRIDLADFAGRRVLLRWRMACDDSAGIGGGWWVDEIRLIVEHPCQSCVAAGPPTGLTAEATGEGVALAWNDVPGASSYLVARSPDGGGPLQALTSVSAPDISFHDRSVSGGTGYRYAVAVGGDCRSDLSPSVTVEAGGPCRRAPLFWGLDEVTDRREPGCALDLSWRPATPGCAGAEVRYRVYRSPSPAFEPGPDTLLETGVAGPRFRDLSVLDSERYHYRVRAVDDVSLAEESNPVEHPGSTTGPDEVLLSDSVENGTEGWWTGLGSAADSGTEPWRVVDDMSHDGDRSWFCADEPRVKDQVVGLVGDFAVADPSTVLVFHHFFDLEPFWDGGRLEVTTDGGSTWHDVLEGDGGSVGENPARFLRGGYTGIVSPGTGHPFAGKPAWTGFDVAWTETVVDLGDFVGLTVGVRWRLGCDNSDARTGWWLDDVELRITSTCTTVELPPLRTIGGRRP